MPAFTRIRALLLALLLLALAGCAEPPLQEPAIDSEHSCRESAFIIFKNPEPREMYLDRWVLSDNSGEYKLPVLRLPPHGTIRVWRGVGQDDAANLYLGQPATTWQLGNSAEKLEVERRSIWPLWGRVQIYFLGNCHSDPGY